jgi:hypothetical protein
MLLIVVSTLFLPPTWPLATAILGAYLANRKAIVLTTHSRGQTDETD